MNHGPDHWTHPDRLLARFPIMKENLRKAKDKNTFAKQIILQKERQNSNDDDRDVSRRRSTKNGSGECTQNSRWYPQVVTNCPTKKNNNHIFAIDVTWHHLKELRAARLKR
eukprot:GEZU01025623.1.p1 GENE.GEZU01025623.1~~GEZU01025623.1.p1  ORF type:complete len:111 (+),score=8.35 GEZU01025623.1:362-694(+)